MNQCPSIEWNLQEENDIYDAVKDWSPCTFKCIMKDGTTQRFYGIMDEDYEGTINIHIEEENNIYDVDDIVKWMALE